MEHSLLNRKVALDALLEALNDGTEQPGADKEYEHPFGSKGTEPEDTKFGSKDRWALRDYQNQLARPSGGRRFIQASEEDGLTSVMNDFLRENLDKQASEILSEEMLPITDKLKKLRELALEIVEQAVQTTVRAKARPVARFFSSEFAPGTTFGNLASEHYLGDLVQRTEYFERMYVSQEKQAKVEFHGTPQQLPPRDDLRRHLDEELEEELEPNSPKN